MARMTLEQADVDALVQFASTTTRAVLVTRRKDGGLQSSPMAVLADSNGDVLTATPARSAKTYNLARDPRVAVCLLDERWPGPWLSLEGEAHITRMPEALPLLTDYYTRRGIDPASDGFRERIAQNRVLIRIKPERIVRSGA
jgi:PPOX class probable F420-dependent enzyme